MRFSLAIAACVGLALVAATASGQSADQGQKEPTSRLLVLRGDRAVQPDSGLTILRGSSAPQRAVKRSRPGRRC